MDQWASRTKRARHPLDAALGSAHQHDVETTCAIVPVPGEIVSCRGDEPLALGRRDAAGGAPERLRRAGANLDEYQRGAGGGDEIDLAEAAAVEIGRASCRER